MATNLYWHATPKQQDHGAQVEEKTTTDGDGSRHDIGLLTGYAGSTRTVKV